MTVEWAHLVVALAGLAVMLLTHAFYLGKKSSDLANSVKLLEATIAGKLVAIEAENTHCAEDRKAAHERMEKIEKDTKSHGLSLAMLGAGPHKR